MTVTQTEPVKQCRKCKQDRPVSLFTKRTSAKDGLNYWCKACCFGIELEPEKPAAPELDFSEQKEIAERFILSHLAANGEACDLFLQHRLPYEHREVTGEAVERVIKVLLREGKVKVTRWEACDQRRVNFLALA